MTTVLTVDEYRSLPDDRRTAIEISVKARWGRAAPANIGGALRLSTATVRAIAEEMGLPPAPAPHQRIGAPPAPPARPWPRETLTWALANPAHPEARIILGEMDRRIPSWRCKFLGLA